MAGKYRESMQCGDDIHTVFGTYREIVPNRRLAFTQKGFANAAAAKGHEEGWAGTTTVTVRLKNGTPAITDGPFAETKEPIGGFHLVECRNLDEAIAIALRIPTLPAGGSIEVRPVEHAIQV